MLHKLCIILKSNTSDNGPEAPFNVTDFIILEISSLPPLAKNDFDFSLDYEYHSTIVFIKPSFQKYVIS